MPGRSISSAAAKASRLTALIFTASVAAVCFGLVVMSIPRSDLASAWPLLAILGLNAMFFSVLALNTLRSRVVENAQVVNGVLLLRDAGTAVYLAPRDVKSMIAARTNPYTHMWLSSLFIRKSDGHRAVVVVPREAGLFRATYVCVGADVPELVSAAASSGFRVFGG